MNPEMVMWLKYVGPLVLGLVGIIVQQTRTLSAIQDLRLDINTVKLRTSKVEIRVDSLEEALIIP